MANVHRGVVLELTGELSDLYCTRGRASGQTAPKLKMRAHELERLTSDADDGRWSPVASGRDMAHKGTFSSLIGSVMLSKPRRSLLRFVDRNGVTHYIRPLLTGERSTVVSSHVCGNQLAKVPKPPGPVHFHP